MKQIILLIHTIIVISNIFPLLYQHTKYSHRRLVFNMLCDIIIISHSRRRRRVFLENVHLPEFAWNLRNKCPNIAHKSQQKIH